VTAAVRSGAAASNRAGAAGGVAGAGGSARLATAARVGARSTGAAAGIVVRATGDGQHNRDRNS
jgi:hypothetical protein